MKSDLEKKVLLAPRPIDAKVSPSLLTRSLWPLPQSSKIVSKSLRAIYGKQFKHMIRLGSAFQLKPTNHAQIWEIFWKGRKLGETHPFPSSIPDKDVFLIATGPSLKELDLSPLRDQITFGVNGAIAVTQPLKITPDFFACFDYKFFRDRMQLVQSTVESGAHCFFSAHGLSQVCQKAPELLIKGKISLLETVNQYYGLPSLSSLELKQACDHTPSLVISPNNPKVGWSHDISLGVFNGKTISYVACQIANSLKARNVYILGMDLGSSPNQPIRAYESGPKATSSSLDKDFETTILPSFALMSQQTTTSQFWNLSPNSRLPSEIIPKISFNEIVS